MNESDISATLANAHVLGALISYLEERDPGIRQTLLAGFEAAREMPELVGEEVHKRHQREAIERAIDIVEGGTGTRPHLTIVPN